MLTGNRLEIDFGLGDMQEGFFAGHGLGLGAVEDIIRRSRDFGHKVLRRADGRKGFYSYHGIEIGLLWFFSKIRFFRDKVENIFKNQ